MHGKKIITPASAHSHRHHALILDVRNPDEYQECHIAGSVLHPLPSLDSETVLALRKDSEFCYLVCAAGKRASIAADILSASGHEEIHVIEGGMQGWLDAGLPVIRKEALR